MKGDGKAEVQPVHQEGVIHGACRFETRLLCADSSVLYVGEGNSDYATANSLLPSRWANERLRAVSWEPKQHSYSSGRTAQRSSAAQSTMPRKCANILFLFRGLH
jgi:hypothetical protein